MAEIDLNLKHTGITQKNILEYKQQIENIHKELHKRANDENDFVRMVRIANKL